MKPSVRSSGSPKLQFGTKNPKLAVKVFLFLLGFCALLLAMLWLSQTVFLERFYRRVRLMEVRRSANEIIQNIDNEELPELVRNFNQVFEVVIDIVDMNGRSFFQQSPIQNRFYIEDNANQIQMALNNKGEFYEFISMPISSVHAFGTITGRPDPSQIILSDRLEINQRSPQFSRRIREIQTLIFVKIGVNNSGEEFAVIIRGIVSPLDSTVIILHYQLRFISIFIIILALILAGLIARHVAKPIEKISKSALSLGEGNYDTEFSGKGYREIAVLSDTLNTAAKGLGKVERLRRELLANVSHDLRTPLALIFSYAEMMHDFPEEITREQTETIMEEVKRLTSLVNDVLDISRMENEMEELKLSKFNITQSIKEICEGTEKLLAKDNFAIKFSASLEDDVYVTGDRVKLTRAFYNLLINAINYSGDSREILVEQVITEEHVRISVIDHGEGIGEDEIPHIWDRYYKSDKTHKRAITGTGLGLSIVKKIIDIHGGIYGVSSEPGKGSTFWFEITKTQ